MGVSRTNLFRRRLQLILSVMEKKVENPKSSSKAVNSVQENLINGKELVQLFQKMTVAREKMSSNSTKTAKPIMHRVRPSSRLKKKSKISQKPKSSSVHLRPSKLSQVVKNSSNPKSTTSSQTESRFIDFSADCSRELETIVKDSKTSSTDLTEKDALTKAKNNKRKTSCAQQARNESDAVNLSIDILTDYLDEAILFPKKMSYMAELMYT